MTMRDIRALMRRFADRLKGTEVEPLPEGLPDEPMSRPVSMELMLDGADVLNWRSADPQVEALVLRPTSLEEEPVTSRRSGGEGPSRGAVRLSPLVHDSYVITATCGGEERALLLEPGGTSSGTANVAWGDDSRVWGLEDDPERGVLLESTSDDIARFGIRSLKALHGMVMLAVGPIGEGDVVQLADRSSRTVIEVPPLRSEDGVAQFRIGAVQWAAIAESGSGRDDSATVWNLYAADGAGLGRRRRLGWAGSTVREPREVLRYRATTSLMVPGCRIAIRPYWTRDQFMALEVKLTSSIEGELT